MTDIETFYEVVQRRRGRALTELPLPLLLSLLLAAGRATGFSPPAQYVDDQFTLHSGVLATKRFDEKHTGVNIREFTTDILESFGIDVDKCKFTTDSASNNISAFRAMGLLSCAAHNINLVLAHTFDEMPKDFVYETIDETIKNSSELVTFMKRSGLNAKLNKKLVQQVKTRWNSKLAMLRSVAEAHSELLEEFSGKREVRDRLLKVDLDLQGIVKILEPFREASDILQAERVPTLHLVVKCANKLRRGLRQCPDDSLDIQLVKKRLTDNIHRLRIEPLYLAAHALQPDWRQKSYVDWADVREGHRLLLAKATEEAACFTAGEEVQEPRQREARAKTKTFLDSDSDSSDVESPLSRAQRPAHLSSGGTYVQ
ncbi:Transposable element Hobo transposase [Amphibalanus amphitrite]|uniref:Transposable element Hobo transposase n=1 Tax=Amphibalanus amphitrite TaxID=1232801 RepID=A0A6A4W054_AMPAM|nr:Transposable element Hobo transposase [Amphibalanus amphitrite]